MIGQARTGSSGRGWLWGSGTLLQRRCPCSCLHLADSVEAGQPRADPRTRVCARPASRDSGADI